MALVQFDAVPEASDRNLVEMERLARSAVDRGARWIQFHEGCVSDYTPRIKTLAEQVPDGKSTQRMINLAAELNCYISFGLNERNGDRFHISQVFVAPQRLVHCYRKTWLFHTDEDKGYRNELARYDPGTGPSLFEIDGVRAACFICADANSPRCIERLRDLHPQVVFHPNNHINPSPEADWKTTCLVPPSIPKMPFIQALEKELQSLRGAFLQKYPQHVHSKTETEKQLRSAFSNIICTFENKCIKAMEAFWVSKGFHVDVLVYDGLQIRKDPDKPVTDTLLREAEQYVLEHTQFKLTFVLKPMSTECPIKI